MSIHNRQLAKLFQHDASYMLGREIFDSNHYKMGVIDDITERFGTQIAVICPQQREAEAVFALEVPLCSVQFFEGANGKDFGLVDAYDISDTLVQTANPAPLISSSR
jgi:hypothetical protein